MLDGLNGAYGGRFLLAVLGVGLALLVFFVVLKLVRNRAPSPFLRGGRNRQPRLQVLDAAAIDTRRRLVLVRRDDVEHLIMIGGPTDIVIESRIRGARAAVGETIYEPARDRLTASDEADDEAYLDEEDDDTTYPPEPAPIEGMRPIPARSVVPPPQARPAPRPASEPPLSPAEEWRMRADARGAAGDGPRVAATPLAPPVATNPQRSAAEPSLFPEQRAPARPPVEPPRPASAPVRPAPPAATAAPPRPVEPRPEPKNEAKPAHDFDRIMEEEMVRTLEAAKQQAQLSQQAGPATGGPPRSVTLQPKRPEVGPVPAQPQRPAPTAAPVADQRVMQQEMARIFGETGDKR